MLDRNKVIGALEKKRPAFQAYQTAQREQREQLDTWLNNFYRYDVARLDAAIADLGMEWPGALPTAEFDQAEALCLRFPHQWRDHRAARAWALEVLLNRPVLAVDGSQIAPTKDISPAVGAIQVGWFLNEHTAGTGGYVKDVAFEILSPEELQEEEGDESGGSFANQLINRLRFEREVDKLCELMARYADAPTPAKPLCFFDGSFVISFAGTMKPMHARPYVRAVQKLLDCSSRYQVPLVAFVDRSFSRDLIMLMTLLQNRPATLPISDAALIEQCVEKWGDRSPLFRCARNDALSQNGDAGFYKEVLFTYVKLSNDHPPARIELPLWIHEAGRTDEILDLVRAACVVGNGYPYAVETADATAVISMQDRQRFYALYQQFIAQEGLALQQTRKVQSKLSRR
ncbi:MAG: DNA double-strand break repair nuclease NurA [Caldilineaceae bacterium]|nr:DNA double-strand break repair nuclease NurA [Caldilineaceae bacterium]